MQVRRFVRPSLAAAGVMGALTSAHAELPTGITTAVTAASADGLVLVGALAAAGAAVYLIAKLLKRFGISF